MRLDPNPLFRRVISPWYDCFPARWATLIGMLVIAAFSTTGIWVARQNPDYHAHTWMPVTLLLLSLFVIVSTIYRMVRRSYDRYPHDR